MAKKKIGVLALQGDFEAHQKALCEAGACASLVRHESQLEKVQGLVIPGGESTTMLKLLRQNGLYEAIQRFGREHPILGTCAGAILLARQVTHPEQESLGLMDIAVERNAYGRQVDSSVARLTPEADFERRTEPGELETVFIRAPIIRHTGAHVKVLACYKGDPILVEEGLHMAATFHPELTKDLRLHRLFLEKVPE